MTRDTPAEQGRIAFADHSWGAAHSLLRQADEGTPLALDHLERLATAAHLVGKGAEATAVWTRAFNASLESGEVTRAVRAAFHLVMSLFDQGEVAQAGGWLARAQRLLDEGDIDCVERGYLMLPLALRHMEEGDIEAAYATFRTAADIGVRFDDIDLTTLGRLGSGRCTIGLGDRSAGMALLDEVMVTVTTAEVSPLVSGVVYCSVIDACHQIFDLRRAQEWTGALTRWCLDQPDLVAFQGECLVRRAEIMQLHGAWQDALEEVQRARKQLLRASDALPSVRRSTRKARVIVYAGTSYRRKLLTARRTARDGRRNQDSHCCGWRRVRLRRHLHRCSER